MLGSFNTADRVGWFLNTACRLEGWGVGTSHAVYNKIFIEYVVHNLIVLKDLRQEAVRLTTSTNSYERESALIMKEARELREKQKSKNESESSKSDQDKCKMKLLV